MVRTEQETATSVDLQLDSLRQKADLEKLRYQESDIGYRIGYFVSVAFWLGYVFFFFLVRARGLVQPCCDIRWGFSLGKSNNSCPSQKFRS